MTFREALRSLNDPCFERRQIARLVVYGALVLLVPRVTRPSIPVQEQEDVVGCTLVKLVDCDALPELPSERAAEAYLLRALRNTWIDMLRKSHRQVLLGDDDDAVPGPGARAEMDVPEAVRRLRAHASSLAKEMRSDARETFLRALEELLAVYVFQTRTLAELIAEELACEVNVPARSPRETAKTPHERAASRVHTRHSRCRKILLAFLEALVPRPGVPWEDEEGIGWLIEEVEKLRSCQRPKSRAAAKKM